MLFPRPAVFISFILVILFSLRFLPVWQQTKGLCKIKCKQLLGPHKLWKCNLQRCNACLGVGVGVSNRKLITEQGPFLLFVRSLSTHTYIYHIYSIHMQNLCTSFLCCAFYNNNFHANIFRIRFWHALSFNLCAQPSCVFVPHIFHLFITQITTKIGWTARRSERVCVGANNNNNNKNADEQKKTSIKTTNLNMTIKILAQQQQQPTTN